MDSSQDRIKWYNEVLKKRDEEISSYFRPRLNHERWWLKHLELGHLAYCLDGGLRAMERLLEHRRQKND